MTKHPTTPISHLPSPLSMSQHMRLRFFLCCTMALMLLVGTNSCLAQAPEVAPPAGDGPTVSQPAPAEGTTSSPPVVPDFDIDLGTEEFENFGDENFQVDDKLSPAKERTVTTIKIAVVVLIVLLIATVAIKLFKRKSPASS